MYEDENNLYHYSYRKGDEQNPNAPIDTKNYAEDPWDKNPGGSPKKKGGSGLSGKIVALALVCALVGGFIGAGVSGATTKVNKTSVQVSDREVAQVQTVKVDGKTQMSMSEVYASNVNSVVSINVSATTNYFGQTVETAASGTGFFITEDGYILTNHHVVSGASSVSVTLYNGESYDAKVIGSDEDYDIAVIKIDATGLSAAEFASSSTLSVGDSVAAIGNPLSPDLRLTMTRGIVSALNREINYNGATMTLIQTDASINEGNSGGPLFNSRGQVIGITNMKMISSFGSGVEGLGFAIPSDTVESIVQALIEDGAVYGRVSIGVTVGPVSKDIAQYYDIPQGLYVSAVTEGSDAEAKGIERGDIITKVNGEDAFENSDVSDAKEGLNAGDTLTFTVWRDGRTLDITVKLMDPADIGK